MLVFVLPSHGDAVGPLNIRISPNGARCAVPTFEGISVYNTHSGEKLSHFTETHPNENGPPGPLTFSAVNAVAFSPDGKKLASAGSTLRIWDTDTGELQHAADKDLGSINRLIFSPDGKKLATAGGWDLTGHLWDMDTGGLKKTFKMHTGEVRDIAFSPDGHTLTTASRDKTIKL